VSPASASPPARVIGGAIVQGISWQWIFWVNVPVGLVAAVLSALRLRESRGPRPQLDIVGLVLAGAGLFALTWAPVRAPAAGWGSAEVIGAIVAGAALMGGFLAWERRAPYPMLPLGYFRRRAFATANAVIFFQFISLIGSLFFITQLFQIGMGYSPLAAGLRILVWMAMPMLVAPIAGALADRFGNRPFMLGGLVLQAAGLGWLAAAVQPGVSGVGIAMCFPTVANAVTGAVPISDVGVAAGTNNALNALGGVFGIAILAAVFAAHGSYASPASFVAGFKPAEWVAAAAAAAAVVAAALAPSRAATSRAAEGKRSVTDPVSRVGPGHANDATDTRAHSAGAAATGADPAIAGAAADWPGSRPAIAGAAADWPGSRPDASAAAPPGTGA
jgi:MFS family permease